MGFVYSNAFWLCWFLVLEYISLVGWRIPKDGIIDWRHIHVLSDSRNPSWNSLNPVTGGQYHGDLSRVSQIVESLIDLP